MIGRLSSLAGDGMKASMNRMPTQRSTKHSSSAQEVKAEAGAENSIAQASLSFPTILDGNSAVLTVAAIGAVTSQKVMESWPSTLEAGLLGMMRVSAPNTIEVRLFNFSGGPITPAVQTFGATLV